MRACPRTLTGEVITIEPEIDKTHCSCVYTASKKGSGAWGVTAIRDRCTPQTLVHTNGLISGTGSVLCRSRFSNFERWSVNCCQATFR
jgi:hypothetical protein